MGREYVPSRLDHLSAIALFHLDDGKTLRASQRLQLLMPAAQKVFDEDVILPIDGRVFAKLDIHEPLHLPTGVWRFTASRPQQRSVKTENLPLES